jgi:hypothetical protein
MKLRSAEGVLVPALFSYAVQEFGKEFFEEASADAARIWLRSPHLSAHHPFTGPDGALIYVKTGYLVAA